MSNIAIKIVNLTKTYKIYKSPQYRLFEALHPFRKKYHSEFHAIKNINIEIEKGEVIGIIGNNGAGKSTLLKILSGVLTPTSGNYIANGKISALLELGTGFNPEYTGMQNIYFRSSLMGYKKNKLII
jgi:ABC-type polysaccharide/polyol phosphate transport system ATPase subunit